MATITVRPASAGDNTNWPSVTGAATHWQAVSDNSDTSYVRNNTATPQEDDYGLGSSGLTTETINSIDIRFRARSETSAVGEVQVGLRLSATNSLAANQTAIPTTATDYTRTNIARPGGGSFTVSDLSTLQVVAIGDNGGGAAIRLFEVFVDINYTAAGGATVTASTRMTMGMGS